MGTQLQATTWRLPCNQASTANTGSLIGGTGNPLTCWKASTTIVQGALFIGDPTQSVSLVTDLSNIVSVVLAMRVGNASGLLLFPELVIPAANLNAGLQFANWANGTDQHFVFTITTNMLNVVAQNGVWLVIGANTTNAGAFPVAINAAVQIKDPGINNPGDTNNPSVYTGWSKQEADTRYALASSSSFVPTITSVGDGAATSLEAVPTVGLATPALRFVYSPGSDTLLSWIGEPSQAVSVTGVSQRAADWAASGVVWFRKALA